MHLAGSEFPPKFFPLLSSIFLCDCLLLFPRVTFSLSVYCCLMLPSLWTPTAPYHMVALLKFSLMWMASLVRCSFISLSITRMFLLFKVSSVLI